YYSYFPIGNMLALAPGYALCELIGRASGLPPALLIRLGCHISPMLLGALLCTLFFAMARRDGASERAALASSLALGLATSIHVYARIPYCEILQALALTWVVERAFRLGERLSLRTAAGFGVAASVLFASKLAYIVLLIMPTAYICWKRRAE